LFPLVSSFFLQAEITPITITTFITAAAGARAGSSASNRSATASSRTSCSECCASSHSGRCSCSEYTCQKSTGNGATFGRRDQKQANDDARVRGGNQAGNDGSFFRYAIHEWKDELRREESILRTVILNSTYYDIVIGRCCAMADTISKLKIRITQLHSVYRTQCFGSVFYENNFYHQRLTPEHSSCSWLFPYFPQ
jgi:hypothetical protein